MIGTTAIRRYVAVMGTRGYPPDVVLADSRLNHSMLADPARLIEPSQYRTIVNNLLKLSGEEGIGLAMSAFRDLGDLGIVGHASSASRTVRDTYQVWSRFGPALVGMLGQLRILEEDARSVTFVVANPEPDDPLFRFSVEELLTMVRKVSRAPADDCPSVEQLSLSYRTPRHADRYEELFGCPTRFGSSRTTIRVRRDWFDQPKETHDEEFNAVCLQHCESVLRRTEGTKPATIKLQKLFAQNHANLTLSLEAASRLLNLTPRTLRRRLNDEGTSFRSELNWSRAERAKQYFSYGTVNPKEVGFLVGFKEQSAFRHAFKQWTGMTIREYREQAMGEAYKPAPSVDFRE